MSAGIFRVHASRLLWLVLLLLHGLAGVVLLLMAVNHFWLYLLFPILCYCLLYYYRYVRLLLPDSVTYLGQFAPQLWFISTPQRGIVRVRVCGHSVLTPCVMLLYFQALNGQRFHLLLLPDSLAPWQMRSLFIHLGHGATRLADKGKLL